MKNQFRFIDDVFEINDQSRCILSGLPYIELYKCLEPTSSSPGLDKDPNLN